MILKPLAIKAVAILFSVSVITGGGYYAYQNTPLKNVIAEEAAPTPTPTATPTPSPTPEPTLTPTPSEPTATPTPTECEIKLSELARKYEEKRQTINDFMRDKQVILENQDRLRAALNNQEEFGKILRELGIHKIASMALSQQLNLPQTSGGSSTGTNIDIPRVLDNVGFGDGIGQADGLNVLSTREAQEKEQIRATHCN